MRPAARVYGANVPRAEAPPLSHERGVVPKPARGQAAVAQQEASPVVR